MHLSNPRRWVSQNYAEKKGKDYGNTHKGSSTDLGSKGTEIWRIELQTRGADHSQETEARWLEKGRKSAKNRGGKVEALKVDPSKSSGGDLRGRRVDFNGSEREVTDLEKRRLKLWKTDG